MFKPLPYEERETKRGMLTEKASKLYLDLTGKELTVRKLRLFPYLMDTLLNSHKIDPRHINNEESVILRSWESEGYISLKRSHSEQSIVVEILNYDFYKMMSEILFVSYVNIVY